MNAVSVELVSGLQLTGMLCTRTLIYFCFGSAIAVMPGQAAQAENTCMRTVWCMCWMLVCLVSAPRIAVKLLAQPGICLACYGGFHALHVWSVIRCPSSRFSRRVIFESSLVFDSSRAKCPDLACKALVCTLASSAWQVSRSYGSAIGTATCRNDSFWNSSVTGHEFPNWAQAPLHRFLAACLISL